MILGCTKVSWIALMDPWCGYYCQVPHGKILTSLLTIWVHIPQEHHLAHFRIILQNDNMTYRRIIQAISDRITYYLRLTYQRTKSINYVKTNLYIRERTLSGYQNIWSLILALLWTSSVCRRSDWFLFLTSVLHKMSIWTPKKYMINHNGFNHMNFNTKHIKSISKIFCIYWKCSLRME